MTYLCIDLKSYYASAECVARGLDPLTSNLLVADESRTDKTICLAVSPALKAVGVPGRPRLFEARQCIRTAEAKAKRRIPYVVAVPRMQTYIDISAQIYAIYLRFVSRDDIHIYSIDECFIDVTGYLRFYGNSAERMARQMVHAVLMETGITATVGIGDNLFLAKVAMDVVAKRCMPDRYGVRLAALDERSFRALLWDHRPITDIWQIGVGTARRLLMLGVSTLGQLARLSLQAEEELYRVFGVNAELLIDHAWGRESCTMQDIKAYRPRERSLSQGQVLPRPYAHEEARVVLREMTQMLALQLLGANLSAGGVVLSVHFDPASLDSGLYKGPVHLDYYGRLTPNACGGTVRFEPPAATERELCRGVLDCFDGIDPALLVRRLSVCAIRLCSRDRMQLSFLTDTARQVRDLALEECMLSLKAKRGGGSIFMGDSLLEGATMLERSRQIGGHRA